MQRVKYNKLRSGIIQQLRVIIVYKIFGMGCMLSRQHKIVGSFHVRMNPRTHELGKHHRVHHTMNGRDMTRIVE